MADILTKTRLEYYYEIEEIMKKEESLKYINSEKVKKLLLQEYIDFEIFQDGYIRITNKNIKEPFPQTIYCPDEATILYMLENNLSSQIEFDERVYEYKKDIKINEKRK